LRCAPRHNAVVRQKVVLARKSYIDCRAGDSIWLIGEFAEPDLVGGLENFVLFGVDGSQRVNGGLGDAELSVLRIVPVVIIERDDGAGPCETET
jgi:hypothetical protein